MSPDSNGTGDIHGSRSIGLALSKFHRARSFSPTVFVVLGKGPLTLAGGGVTFLGLESRV